MLQPQFAKNLFNAYFEILKSLFPHIRKAMFIIFSIADNKLNISTYFLDVREPVFPNMAIIFFNWLHLWQNQLHLPVLLVLCAVSKINAA